MIEAQSNSILRVWFNTNIPSIKQSPKIKFIYANKMRRIFGAMFPGKAQFQRTRTQTNPPMMLPRAFIITCPIAIYFRRIRILKPAKKMTHAGQRVFSTHNGLPLLVQSIAAMMLAFSVDYGFTFDERNFFHD